MNTASVFAPKKKLFELRRRVATYRQHVLFSLSVSSAMLFQHPSRSDVLTVAAYWLVATPFLVSGYVYEFGWMWGVAAMAYNIVLDTAAAYCVVFGLLPNIIAAQHWRRALTFLPLFLLASAVLYNGGYLLLIGEKASWTPLGLLTGLLRHTVSYGLLASLLTGKRYFEMQQRLMLVQKVQAENELRHLKAQIDPHFLFNNLNVLRGLIQQDPVAANEYLTHFAGLYRMLIRHKDEDFVSVGEELRFADEYIYLLRQRFGSAYEFRREVGEQLNLNRLLVVPGTLQLLVENAVKHNAGDEENPLQVIIEATATTLTVRHKRRPKLTPVDSTGTGLSNLRERYRLLFGRDILIVDTAAVFLVSVPVISPKQTWSASL